MACAFLSLSFEIILLSLSLQKKYLCHMYTVFVHMLQAYRHNMLSHREWEKVEMETIDRDTTKSNEAMKWKYHFMVEF